MAAQVYNNVNGQIDSIPASPSVEDLTASGDVTITGDISADSATFGGTTNLTLPEYADNAAARTGGLVTGDLYQTSAGVVMVTQDAG